MDWPADRVVKKPGPLVKPAVLLCPVCDGKVDWISNGEPISASDANHRLFEKYFEAWDARRIAAQEKEIAGLRVTA